MSEAFDEFVAANHSVDRHEGNYAQWLERHDEVCARVGDFGKPGIAEVTRFAYQRLRDDRNLINALEHVAHESGDTAGPDTMTYADVADRPFACARAIRDAIDDGLFEHGPTRITRIPKKSGLGTRPIQVLNFMDRVLHRGIVQVLGPLLDATFDDRSFGFRRGLDREHALAAAERFCDDGHRVWLCVDLADAFEHIPQQRLRDVLRTRLPVRPEQEIKRRRLNAPISENLHSLLGKIIETDRRVGIRQGAPTSSLFLNVYADHHFDRKWRRQHPDLPALRYADDLLILCKSTEEAEVARQDLEALLLPTGMRLKGPDGDIFDLDQGQAAEWLGFRVTWTADGLRVSVSERAYERLRCKFVDAATMSAGDRDLPGVTLGWIGQLGPAYEHVNRCRYHWKIGRLANSHNLVGVPDFDTFDAAWRAAFLRWQEIRDAAQAQAA